MKSLLVTIKTNVQFQISTITFIINYFPNATEGKDFLGYASNLLLYFDGCHGRTVTEKYYGKYIPPISVFTLIIE